MYQIILSYNKWEPTFGEHISGIKWYAVGLRDGRVEIALHIIDGLRDEVETEKFVSVEVVEKTSPGQCSCHLS